MEGTASFNKCPNKQPVELGLGILLDLIFKFTLKPMNTDKCLILQTF